MSNRVLLALILSTVAVLVSGCTYRRSFLRTSGVTIPEVERMVEATLEQEGYVNVRHKNKGRSKVKEGETFADLSAGADSPAVTAKFIYKLRRDGVEIQMRVRGPSRDAATKVGQPLGERLEAQLNQLTMDALAARNNALGVPGPRPVNPLTAPSGTTDRGVTMDTPDAADADEVLEPESGVKHCLIVGISRYRGTFEDLAAARRDAEMIKKKFQEQGVPADHMHLLVDKDAKQASIIEMLTQIAQKARKGDTIIVYFAGHGRAPNAEARYLVPYDARTESVHGTMIPIQRMEDILNSSDAQRQLVLLDCCFAEPGSRTRASVADNAFEPLGGKGRVVITSAKGSQRALDAVEGELHSPFAQALIDVFDGNTKADLDGDGRITAEELHEAIHDPVRDKAKEHSLDMNPQIYGRAAKDIRFINRPE